MRIVNWEQLPQEMQSEQIRKYYDILKRKRISIIFKRVFDIAASSILIVILLPVFLILAIAIKLDSPGPVFFRQVRLTQYGKQFRIFKFRTMVSGADEMGSQVTVKNDARITRVGAVIRKYRLDEICQLFDVFRGTMTFVGTRPESLKYTAYYTPEMKATFLFPAGVTSLASIYYKDEAELLENVDNVDAVYVEKILPQKMHYNLKGLVQFSFWGDIKILFMTVFAILGKEYKGEHHTSEAENVMMR